MNYFSHTEIIKTKSKRGKEKIFFEGFAYNFRHEQKNHIVWRCRNDKCPSYFYTTKENVFIRMTTHNHEPNFEKNRVDYDKVLMKKRAVETKERARDIIIDTIKCCTEPEFEILPNFKSLTDQIKILRNKKYQIFLPNNSDIPSAIKNMPNGEPFIQHDSGILDESRIVVFATDLNLIHLENSKVVLMDGTFKSCPPGFKQLYTLVTHKNNLNIPLVFILMRSKNTASYIKVADFLKQKIPKFSPDMIILDFEVAPRRSFSEVFPDVKFFGFLFHFCQNIWRKIQDLRLTKTYMDNSTFRYNIRLLMSLSFVKPENLIRYYNILEEYISLKDLTNLYKEILLYFRKNYIEISCEDMLFLNVYERGLGGSPRTTNCLEGFHRAINSLFIKSHPDIGLFCEELQKETILNGKKMLNALYKNIPRNTKQEEKNNRLKIILLNYDDYSPLDFLRSVSLVYSWPV